MVDNKETKKYMKYFPLISFAMCAVNLGLGSWYHSSILTAVGIVFGVFGFLQLRLVKHPNPAPRRAPGFKYPTKATKRKYHPQQKNHNKK